MITYSCHTKSSDYEKQFGLEGDIPVRGDYDGDGKLDVAVFRPDDGMWHILESSNGYYSELFGASGDMPPGVSAVYNANRAAHQTFAKAPSWAVPKRRVFHTDKSGQTAAD